MTRGEYYYNVAIRYLLFICLLAATPVLIFYTVLFDNLLGDQDHDH